MKYIKSLEEIRRVLKELNDIVVPTMGAKGLLAGIAEEFDKPTMTDDGVTVIKALAKMEGWGKMITSGAIEAAHNTEKVAFDGTTLTILMTHELFDLGYRWIKAGMHPQKAASIIEAEIKKLKIEKVSVPKKKLVRDVANISTKIEWLGDVLVKAHKLAGDEMNILVEHDREHSGISIETEKGYAIDSGYFSEALRTLCQDGEKTEFQNAKVAILKEGVMSQEMIAKFFGSIPKDQMAVPIVFVVDPSFNPEALRLIIETVIENNLICQFVFVNEPEREDVFLDIAAISGAKVQDPAAGIKNYVWQMCGEVEKVRIEKDKTLFAGSIKAEDRIKEYKSRLGKKKFSLSESSKALASKRLSALSAGIVKIKVGASTIVEFKTLKLKLEDGIGAVREALKRGVCLGAGKALWNCQSKVLGTVLKKPAIQIARNAGHKVSTKIYRDKNVGLNVVTGLYVNLIDEGILDSIASIEEALTNASSIACTYLRTYILID